MTGAVGTRSDFYVYVWRRPSGEPFYIGRGCGRRAKSTQRRNTVFKNIVAKIRATGTDPKVERIVEGLTEREAFDLEVELIAEYRLMKDGGTLSNLTYGGEGASSFTQESRAKISGFLRAAHPKAEFKGVCKHLKNGKWVSKIFLDGKVKNLGSFSTPKDAARAYDIAAVEAWGIGKCYLNFPEEINEPAPVGGSPSKAQRMRGQKSGKFKGVSPIKRSGKWLAQIRIDGRLMHLGIFDEAEDAARAYDVAASAAWGSDCYLNFTKGRQGDHQTYM